MAFDYHHGDIVARGRQRFGGGGRAVGAFQSGGVAGGHHRVVAGRLRHARRARSGAYPAGSVGLSLGFLGVALLLLPNGAPFLLDHFGGQLSILLAALLWSVGSIYGKRQPQTTPPLMSAAMQMLTGGLFLCGISLIGGETGAWVWSLQGMSALTYLIVFGTLGFASHIWLLHNVVPAHLGTYAYVNPAVAVLLGRWLLDEALTGMQLMGMAVILTGVITVSLSASPEKT